MVGLFIVLLLVEVPLVPPDSHLCFLKTTVGSSSAPPPGAPIRRPRLFPWHFPRSGVCNCRLFCLERLLAPGSPCQGAAVLSLLQEGAIFGGF